MDILIISIISGTILGFLAEPIYNGIVFESKIHRQI